MDGLERRLRERKKHIAFNMNAALLFASACTHGTPHKAKKAEVMQRTGIARTTLMSLMDGDDLRHADIPTLQKMADYVGVPLPFLLMSPGEWMAMARVCESFATYQLAAQAQRTAMTHDPKQAEAILRDCKVHPTQPPMGLDPTTPEFQRGQAALQSINDWRQRCSLMLAAMAQSAAKGHQESGVRLTALAAALSNELTAQNTAIPPKDEL